MAMVFSQAAPFTGAAYEYLRADDALPTYREIADEHDPLCRVTLFPPGWPWTYYVCAVTEYEGIEGPVLTGYCVSPLAPEYDDQALAESPACGSPACRRSATCTSSPEDRGAPAPTRERHMTLWPARGHLIRRRLVGGTAR